MTDEADKALAVYKKLYHVASDQRDAAMQALGTAEGKLDSIAGIAGGDYGINTEHSMERIYSIASGQPMRKPCPECRGGEDGGPYRPRLGSGTIVMPCQTCHGAGRVAA